MQREDVGVSGQAPTLSFNGRKTFVADPLPYTQTNYLGETILI
jgi:hypothetical protein